MLTKTEQSISELQERKSEIETNIRALQRERKNVLAVIKASAKLLDSAIEKPKRSRRKKAAAASTSE